MDDDTVRCLAGNKRRPRPAFEAGLVLAGLLAVGLLAAGCGSSGSNDPAGAGAGRATGTAAPSAAASSGIPSPPSQAQQQQLLLELAQCLRSHGVPNFPDPSPGAGMLQTFESWGGDSQSPAFRAALQACHEYTPDATLTPAQIAAQNAQGVAESQCMRSHGVPNYPDPTTGPLGEQVINLRGTGIDPSNPTVQAAINACAKLYPGMK